MHISGDIIVDGAEISYTATIDTQHNTYTINTLNIYGSPTDVGDAIDSLRQQLADLLDALRENVDLKNTPARCNGASILNGYIQYCQLEAGHFGFCEFGSTFMFPVATHFTFGDTSQFVG